MADLIYYIRDHGYSEDDLIWVSDLAGHYYVDDPDTDTFKITDSPDGDNVQYSTTVTSGWVREVDPTSGILVIENLGNLEGMQVRVTSSGVDYGTYTVENAKITLADHVYTHQVGLMYGAKIKTMRFSVPGNGNVQTRIKSIGRQTVRYLKAKDIQIGQEAGGKEYLSNAAATYEKYSQDITPLNDAPHDRDAYSLVKSVAPFPMTVLGIVVDIEVTEK